MKYKLRMEPETVLELITSGNRAARNLTDDVEWSAEDGSRTEPGLPVPLRGSRHQGRGHHHQHP
jgi:isopropylmalate/homocitrate/citramalate synthase